MDSAWLARTKELESSVLRWVATLLEHTRSNGAVLQFQRPGEGAPTFVVIGREDVLDDLRASATAPIKGAPDQPPPELGQALPSRSRTRWRPLRTGRTSRPVEAHLWAGRQPAASASRAEQNQRSPAPRSIDVLS